MRILFIMLLIAITVLSTCSRKKSNNNNNNNNNNNLKPKGFILIKGGSFVNQNSNLYAKKAILPDFYIGKHEITQKEWVEVMGSNPSKFKGDYLPVEMVNWYDCIEYCIKRSTNEGLKPFYNLEKNKKDPNNKSEYDSLKWIVTINPKANGYRLPTEAEWEYAAGGGQMSKNYTYSGSNTIDDVAWHWRNCGDTILTGNWGFQRIEQNNGTTKPVGLKKPNELRLYDMTGNVREWCEDWYIDNNNPTGLFRSQRGGGWIGVETYSKSSDRDNFEANGVGPDQGFRICRNK